MSVLSDDIARFVRAIGPAHDDVQAEMAAHAEELDFPTVGPEVGGLLMLLARLTDARRVFEFGSGFGYSASWFLRGMPADGHVVLTEYDEAELNRAREFLERGGVADRASFEAGDAVATVDVYTGPFDVVLIDHEKSRYPAAFRAVRDKVAVGGVVVADNAVTAGPIDFDDLLAHATGEDVAMNEATRGVAAYLDTVREDSDFETVVLPLGEGVAVSVRVA